MRTLPTPALHSMPATRMSAQALSHVRRRATAVRKPPARTKPPIAIAAGMEPPGELSSTEGAGVRAMRGSTRALEKANSVATLIRPEMTILKREPVVSLGSIPTCGATAPARWIGAALKRQTISVRSQRDIVRTGLQSTLRPRSKNPSRAILCERRMPTRRLAQLDRPVWHWGYCVPAARAIARFGQAGGGRVATLALA